MKLLVSICNKARATDSVDPDVYLYKVDAPGGEPIGIRLDHPDILPAGGVTGLARYKDGILAVTQADRTQLVLLDQDLAVRRLWTLNTVRDAHGLLVRDNDVLIVSTGNDSVVSFDPDGGELLYWQANQKDKDSLHLNSLVTYRGRVLLTGFGRKSGKFWRTASNGFVKDLSDNSDLAGPIFHPHTALNLGGDVYYLESFRSRVFSLGGGRLDVDRGYLRGMAAAGDHLFMGCSTGRVYSRSTGSKVDESDAPDLSRAACEVLIFDWAPGNLASCRLAGTICFDRHGREIFDILPLADPAGP